jgi:hypothetical protein
MDPELEAFILGPPIADSSGAAVISIDHGPAANTGSLPRWTT